MPHPVPPRTPFAPSAPGAAADVDALAPWEALTRDALAAQAAGRLERALAAQVRALWLAEALLEGPLLDQRPDDCLAALVVSHHNLSEFYRRRGQASQAAEHLCEPHRVLQRLTEDAAHPLAVQQAARRHLRETRAHLLAWLRQHGAEPAIEAALHAAAPPALARRPMRLH